MAGGFAEIAEKFDRDSWINEWANVDDITSDALNEDADYIAETLKKIADELAEAEKEPDMGLITLNYIQWNAYTSQVDNAKLSSDIAALVANLSTAGPQTTNGQDNETVSTLYCTNCGTELTTESNFCSNCGVAVTTISG